MLMPYFYDLWDGKNVIGFYRSPWPLKGKEVIIYEISTLKQLYSRKAKTITVPLVTRTIKNDGVEVTYRIVLDIRRKSTRQIDIIKEGYKL